MSILSTPSLVEIKGILFLSPPSLTSLADALDLAVLAAAVLGRGPSLLLRTADAGLPLPPSAHPPLRLVGPRRRRAQGLRLVGAQRVIAQHALSLFPFGPSHHGPLAGGRAGRLSEFRGKGLLGEGVFVWPGDPTRRPLPGPHAVPGLPSHSPAATLRGRRVAPASRWDRPCMARGGPAVVHVVVAPLYCPPYPAGSSHRVVLQRAALRQPPALPSLPGIPPEVPVHGDLGLQPGLTRPTLSPTSFSASSSISPEERFIFGERKNHFVVNIGGPLKGRHERRHILLSDCFLPLQSEWQRK